MTYSNLIFAAVILPLSILALFFDRSTEYKNLILCIVSLLFLAWGRSFGVLLVVLSIAVDYVLAYAVQGSGVKTAKSAVFMIVDLLWNAFLFVLLTKNEIFASDGIFHLRNALLPVGMAFYTLKNFSYVYDVFSGRIKAEKNIFCLFTYSVGYMFLLAGPLVRYGDIEPQIRHRELTTKKLSDGITRFAIGLAKAVMVVPVLERLYTSGLSADEPTFAGAWLGMIAFFGYAYFAFAGLSDMGTGIALMNGFDTDVNYRRISLGNMLGGLVESYNTSFVKFLSDVRSDYGFAEITTVLLALFAALFYADVKYLLVFGLIIGLILAIEYHIGCEKIKSLNPLLKLALTFVLSMLLFSPFAFESFSEWKVWLLQLVGKGNLYALSTSVKYTIINNCWLLALALISVSPLGSLIQSKLNQKAQESVKSMTAAKTLKTVCTAVILTASYILLAVSTLEAA